MALYKIKKQHPNVGHNAIEMMVVMYKFEFLSGNTMRKVYPSSPRYYERVCKELIRLGYVREAFDNTVVSITIQKDKYNLVEDRMLRKRFSLTNKGRELVEDFYAMTSKFIIDHDAPRIVESETRSNNITFSKVRDEDVVASKSMGIGNIPYYEEEDNMWGDPIYP